MNKIKLQARREMKNIDVNNTPEIRKWTKEFINTYGLIPIPVGFIYAVAWHEIYMRKINELSNSKVKE